ncbi:MAG: hypothetical protein HQK59_09850 [Deltaproteobacteria bacterium]|nr:hypothetical protein [Deltaproteobacteria bacterium]
MKINCSEYRQTMLLLSLRNRLQGEHLAAAERRQLEEEIRRLESALALDD